MLPIHLVARRIRAAEDQCVKCSVDRLLRARRLLTPNSMGHHTGLLAEQTSTAGRVHETANPQPSDGKANTYGARFG